MSPTLQKHSVFSDSQEKKRPVAERGGEMTGNGNCSPRVPLLPFTYVKLCPCPLSRSEGGNGSSGLRRPSVKPDLVFLAEHDARAIEV